MQSSQSKAVLITGYSSGIGRATALYLVKQGWTVYATARKVEGLDDLEQADCHLLPLDVTDEASMRSVVAWEVVLHFLRAIASPHPKARYTVTPSARLLITLWQILPDNVWDRFLGGQFPRPR